MFKKRLVALLCGAVVVSGLAVGCGSGDDEKGGTSKITVSGSTSVGPTMEVLAQAYEKNNDVKIEVQQVGSSAGIKNTIEGTSDLGMSSRDLKDEEAQSVDGTQIAIDGIAVVTHKDNKVTDLTIDQVKDIFTGKITNWKEVGGDDAKIVALSRDSSSGTHEFFKEHIIREGNSKGTQEYGAKTLYMPSNEAIKQEIKANKYAIGYIGMGYMDSSVEAITVDGAAATPENVLNKTYPIAREVFWYADAAREGEVKGIVDYAVSSEGQEIMKNEGFVPVK